MRVALRTPIVGKLGEEFDRMFDRLLPPRLYTEPLLPPFPFETAGAEWMPLMDVIENAEEYIVRLEAPGIHKDNLDINLVREEEVSINDDLCASGYAAVRYYKLGMIDGDGSPDTMMLGAYYILDGALRQTMPKRETYPFADGGNILVNCRGGRSRSVSLRSSHVSWTRCRSGPSADGVSAARMRSGRPRLLSRRAHRAWIRRRDRPEPARARGATRGSSPPCSACGRGPRPRSRRTTPGAR